MHHHNKPLFIMLLLVISCFFMTGIVNAGSTSVGFRDTRSGAIDVAAFDWTVGNALAIGAIPMADYPSTTSFDFVYQATLGAFNDANGNKIYSTGLGVDYEITLVLGSTVTGSKSPQGATNTFSHSFSRTNGNLNYFAIYYDATKNASALNGTGYNDGTLIMSGTIREMQADMILDYGTLTQFDRFVNNDYPGVTSITGSGALQSSIVITANYINKDFFPNETNDVWMAFNTSLVSYFSQTNPSRSFFRETATPYTPVRGNDSVNGHSATVGQADLQLQADGNSSVIPAPCTGTIGDFVWNDLNRNGVQDAGEPGITNVKVNLLDATSETLQTVTTGTNGGYLFNNLCAGTYTVAVDESTLPPGVLPTPSAVGNDGTVDSNGSPAPVTLPTSSSIDMSIDFGYITPCTGKIGDLVWYDRNRNGIQDNGEPGIAGVAVTLKDASGTTVLTGTTTDTNGLYSFSGLCTGTYTLEAAPPAGYVTTTSLAGSDRGMDSNGSPTLATLTTDASFDTTIDFGYATPCTGTIGDQVWYDRNRNGIQDAGETGISGVTISLLNSGVVMASTQTTGSGNYQFTGLCAGDYAILVDGSTLPAGYAPTQSNVGADLALDSNGSPAPVTLPTDTAIDLTIDFGYVSPCTGAIGNFIWHDQNRNGIQDTGEPGLGGVTVALSDTATTVTTDGNGFYQFTGLCPGTYSVAVTSTTLPAGYSPTIAEAGGDMTTDSNSIPASVSLLEGEKNTTIDFGYVNPCEGVLGDYVWHDLNRNGIQDDASAGIDGVSIKLTYPNGSIKSTTTANGGAYQFSGLCAGNYSVVVDSGTLPPGFAPTTSGAGSDRAQDSNGSPAYVNLPSDVTQDLTIDFGYLSPCTGEIGDFVWNDLNKNGIQDGSELGISGATVLLKNPADNTTLATTTTDPNGVYYFRGLCAGAYKIEVNTATLPIGYVTTLTNAPGSTPANDSNGNPASVTLPIDSSDLTIDFGYYMVTGKVCTLTWGYWKTHSEFGPAPYDDTWALLPNGASTPFFISGQTYYQVLQTSPKGNAYYILAHQFIAAQLNSLNGADTTVIGTQLAEAEALLKIVKPGDRLSSADRNKFIKLAYILDQFNNGNIGPGHCSEPRPSDGCKDSSHDHDKDGHCVISRPKCGESSGRHYHDKDGHCVINHPKCGNEISNHDHDKDGNCVTNRPKCGNENSSHDHDRHGECIISKPKCGNTNSDHDHDRDGSCTVNRPRCGNSNSEHDHDRDGYCVVSKPRCGSINSGHSHDRYGNCRTGSDRS